MKIKNSALLFDMDGTLTDARQLITDDVVKALRSIPPSVKKYLVTGSDMSKIEEQIPNDLLLSLFERVYSCNGTKVWNCNLDMDDETQPIQPELVHKVTLLDHYSEADMTHIVNVLLKIASNTHSI